jgi:hypothetical protein
MLFILSLEFSWINQGLGHSALRQIHWAVPEHGSEASTVAVAWLGGSCT